MMENIPDIQIACAQTIGRELLIIPSSWKQNKKQFHDKFIELVKTFKIRFKLINKLLGISRSAFLSWRKGDKCPKSLAKINSVLDTILFYMETGQIRRLIFDKVVLLSRQAITAELYRNNEDRRNAKNKKVREIYKNKSVTVEGKREKLLSTAKARAKSKGLEFSICLEDIDIIDTCPILGIPLRWGKPNRGDYTSPSLDRIDSSKGYIPGNIQVISWRANVLKRDATIEELLLLGQWAIKRSGI